MYWRLIERSYRLLYGDGTVDEDREQVDLPKESSLSNIFFEEPSGWPKYGSKYLYTILVRTPIYRKTYQTKK